MRFNTHDPAVFNNQSFSLGVGVDLDAEIPHGLFHLPVGRAAAALEVERAVELEFGAVLQFLVNEFRFEAIDRPIGSARRVLREHRERCQVVLQVAIADQIVDQCLRRIVGDAFFLLELRAHDGPLPAADGRCAAGNAHLLKDCHAGTVLSSVDGSGKS